MSPTSDIVDLVQAFSHIFGVNRADSINSADMMPNTCSTHYIPFNQDLVDEGQVGIGSILVAPCSCLQRLSDSRGGLHDMPAIMAGLSRNVNASLRAALKDRSDDWSRGRHASRQGSPERVAPPYYNHTRREKGKPPRRQSARAEEAFNFLEAITLLLAGRHKHVHERAHDRRHTHGALAYNPCMTTAQCLNPMASPQRTCLEIDGTPHQSLPFENSPERRTKNQVLPHNNIETPEDRSIQCSHKNQRLGDNK